MSHYKVKLFIYNLLYFIYFYFILIFIFCSLFTVDFSIVIYNYFTLANRLTENLINKRKILKYLKSSQRHIQNLVKAGDGDSFENSQSLQAVNYFLKKLLPRRLTSNMIAPSATI